jgi:hypothetical protein
MIHQEAAMGNQPGRAMGGACLGAFLGLILGALMGGFTVHGLSCCMPESPPKNVGGQNPAEGLNPDGGDSLPVAAGKLVAAAIAVMVGIAVGGALGAILGSVIGAGVATSEPGRTDWAPETPAGKSIEPDQMID